jgi:hypothetical protein
MPRLNSASTGQPRRYSRIAYLQEARRGGSFQHGRTWTLQDCASGESTANASVALQLVLQVEGVPYRWERKSDG